MMYKLDDKLFYNSFNGTISNYPSLDYMVEKQLNCDLFRMEKTRGQKKDIMRLLVEAKGAPIHINVIAEALNTTAKKAYDRTRELNIFFQNAFGVQPISNINGVGYCISYFGPVDKTSGELLPDEPEKNEEPVEKPEKPEEKYDAKQLAEKKTPKKWFGLAVIAALVVALIVALSVGQAKRKAAERQLEKDITDLQEVQELHSKLQEAASSGDAESQYELGLEYYSSWKESYEKYGAYDNSYRFLAIEWLEKAAEQEYVPAQAALCFVIDASSEPIDNDPDHDAGYIAEKLFNWAERTAKNHDAYGFYSLGKSYFYGYNHDPDYTKALEYFQIVLDGVDPDGSPLTDYMADQNSYPTKGLTQWFLGYYYEFSNSHRDYAKALSYYKLAYDGGNVGVANDISRMYAAGKGVPRNEKLAEEWHNKSGTEGWVGGGLPINDQFLYFATGYRAGNVYQSVQVTVAN